MKIPKNSKTVHFRNNSSENFKNAKSAKNEKSELKPRPKSSRIPRKQLYRNSQFAENEQNAGKNSIKIRIKRSSSPNLTFLQHPQKPPKRLNSAQMQMGETLSNRSVRRSSNYSRGSRYSSNSRLRKSHPRS